jgi:hypothetical protein
VCYSWIIVPTIDALEELRHHFFSLATDPPLQTVTLFIVHFIKIRGHHAPGGHGGAAAGVDPSGEVW